MTKELQSQIALVQGYYHFLGLGMWLGDYIKSDDLSKSTYDVVVGRERGQDFVFPQKTLSLLLFGAYQHADQQNIVEYMTFLNGIRGVIMTTREMLEGSTRYHGYLLKTLGDQFRDFDYLLRWLRNVLVHMTDPRIVISHDGFRAIRDIGADWKSINLTIKPSKIWSDTHHDYLIRVRADLATIKHNERLTNVISEYQLYAIARFCYDAARRFGN